MKQGFGKALALLLVGCLMLSACNDGQENDTADPTGTTTASSTEQDASSSEKTDSSSGSKVDPSLVEEIPTSNSAPGYYSDGTRVYIQHDEEIETGGGTLTMNVYATDKDGKTKVLGEIPNVWSIAGRTAKIDSDCYEFITIAPPVDESEEDLIQETILLRYNVEKDEMEMIHYDVGAMCEWTLPYHPEAYALGRKIVAIDNYYEESAAGTNLITLIEAYDVDTKEWSRVVECSVTNTYSKGEMLYQVCTDGQTIYALHDIVHGGDSEKSLILFDSDLKEVRRIAIGEDLKDVFNRGRIAHIYVWDDTIFVSYSSGNGRSMVFLGSIGDDGIKKVAEYEDARVLQDTYNGAPILFAEELDTIYLFREGSEPQKIRFFVDGVDEVYLVGCHVSGTDMCVSAFFTDPSDISHDVYKDYIVHLDKLGDEEEIYLPK